MFIFLKNNKDEKNYIFFKEWKNTIDLYIDTLDRIDYENLPINDYIQKPYFFKYFNELIKIKNKKLIIENIKNKILDNIINLSDIILLLNHIFNFNKEDKKIIQDYFYKNYNDILKNEINNNKILDNEFFNILSFILYFYIQYYLTYLIITELLYNNYKDINNIDNNDYNNDFNNDIYLLIENNKKNINFKINFLKKKNEMKKIHSFILFYNLIKEISLSFDNL